MDRKLTAIMVAVVLAIWLVGTWVTKYTLEEMAILTPIAVLALGALAAVIMLWVKVVRDSMHRRASAGADAASGNRMPDRADP